MKNLQFLFLLGLGVMSIFACSDDITFQEQIELDKTLIEEYLATNNIDAIEDEDGIYYVITEEGDGGGNPNPGSNVLVNYKGYLLDGSVFDESNGDPRQFNLNGLITAWQIGIPKLSKGGKMTLFTPSYLAYGVSSRPGIPANSPLIFEIELINFQ